MQTAKSLFGAFPFSLRPHFWLPDTGMLNIETHLLIKVDAIAPITLICSRTQLKPARDPGKTAPLLLLHLLQGRKSSHLHPSMIQVDDLTVLVVNIC